MSSLDGPAAADASKEAGKDDHDREFSEEEQVKLMKFVNIFAGKEDSNQDKDNQGSRNNTMYQ